MNSVDLDTHLLRYWEQAGTVSHFSPGQPIYFQWDHSDSFYYIRKGRVRVFFVGSDGRDVTVDIVGEGRVFGETSYLNHLPRLTSVVAITQVELIVCQLQNLLPYLQTSPALMEQVFWILSQTVKNLSYQVRRLSFLSAGERVAAFLLEMTQNPHPSLGIGQDCLPYSHQEIAECTSLQRVTVTRLLQAMKTKGWITTGYKQVRICNRPALQAYAYHNL